MTRIDILEHGAGYMEFIESWGSDEGIIESARMSTNKGFLGWEGGQCSACMGTGEIDAEVKVWEQPPKIERVGRSMMVFHGRYYLEPGKVPCVPCEGKGVIRGDAALLKYLWDKKHSTPFEFAGLTIEIQAPIMVFREWHRHRTQSYSELSARYTPLPDLNYVPTPERCLLVSGTNKQAGAAKGAAELTHEAAIEWLEKLSNVYAHAEIVYQEGLAIGIPKELARLPVPVGRYSRMRATGNLRNWLAFLTLRRDPGAQWEIRQYANVLGNEIISKIFPRTWSVYCAPGAT